MTRTAERTPVSEPLELHMGDTAPAIDAETATGQRFSLADLLGMWVVTYFYPRANTPG